MLRHEAFARGKNAGRGRFCTSAAKVIRYSASPGRSALLAEDFYAGHVTAGATSRHTPRLSDCMASSNAITDGESHYAAFLPYET